MKQGTQAFINDLKTIHTNWIDESRKLQVPITVLRGGLNQDQPVSAFTKYKAAVPHAKMKVIEDAGTYLYLTHFDRVLEELGLLLVKGDANYSDAKEPLNVSVDIDPLTLLKSLVTLPVS